jgi:hypothetical protein
LLEGALTGELTNSIQAHLPDKYFLKCEVAYKKLGIEAAGKERLDMVVFDISERYKDRKKKASKIKYVDNLLEENNPTQILKHVKYAIEVKRNKNKKEIYDDLYWLSKIKRRRKAITTILILVSEKKRPDDYVRKNGLARNTTIKIQEPCMFEFSVKRVLKAASSFHKNRIGKAHYVVLLEVH